MSTVLFAVELIITFRVNAVKHKMCLIGLEELSN